MKQKINYYLTESKFYAQSIIMILELLLNTRMILITFKKIFMNTIQIENQKYQLYLMI